MTEPTETQKTSVITGPRRVGNLLPKLTGTKLGDGGSEVRLTETQREATLTKMAKQPAKDTDENLRVFLERQCGLRHEIQSQMMFPNDKPMYKKFKRVAMEPDHDADLPAALHAIELSLTPLRKHDIAAALAKLRALTKARAESEMDMEITVAAYVDELSNFPADTVRETLEQWPRNPAGMWWPSWHELQETLEQKAGYRKKMREAVRRITRHQTKT